MSDSVRSLRERFLARTEQVRVRVPIDPDAASDLEAAHAERARITDQYEAARQQHDKRKLSEKPPAEPDYTAVDKWIEDAEQRVDENSIMVVLQWRPKVFPALMQQATVEKHTSLQIAIALAEAFYLRSEALEDGTWVDLGLSWDHLSDRLTEGELLQIGQSAHSLANASDAAPFVPRGKTSAKG